MTAPQWTARDEERLADLRKRRADVYNAKREEHPYYGDDDIDLLFRFAAQRSTGAPLSGEARARANVIYDAALVDGTRGRSKLMAEQDIASITPQIEQAIIYGIAAALTAADRARGDG